MSNYFYFDFNGFYFIFDAKSIKHNCLVYLYRFA
jgi:hypothetical protein